MIIHFAIDRVSVVRPSWNRPARLQGFEGVAGDGELQPMPVGSGLEERGLN